MRVLKSSRLLRISSTQQTLLTHQNTLYRTNWLHTGFKISYPKRHFQTQTSQQPIMTSQKKTASTPAPGVPFYTPAQSPPAGTAIAKEGIAVPTLFTPLTVRGMTLTNRFTVSPMCMYSADDGHLTDFHLVHLGSFAMRGAALTIVEASAVTPNGRISPEDSGIWQDSQIAPLKRIVDFVHSQGQKAAIQLAHAGRKASTLSPWHHKVRGQSEVATHEVGGWPDDVWGPSAVPFSPTYPMPKEMTIAEIEGLIQSFGEAAKRAVQAGFDAIEIHGAHGYLISNFLSPMSNTRTDQYGGSFENRIRFVVEVVKAIRAAIPESMPLFLRISATEWMEHTGKDTWDVAQTTELARLLPDLGVDLLDVSSGGNVYEQQIKIHPYYQVDIAGSIREVIKKEGKKLLIGAVGMITTAEMARSIVQEDGTLAGDGNGTVEMDTENGARAKADLVIMARQYLREPEFVLRTAHQLGVEVQWPRQYLRAGWRKDARI
ncbi:NADPH dehydrogenase [Diplogelasinospora grovesii]|uniref:NADPH dehydrogenase n=1 Tax=Diplogelasinospora grovesii TaxID=303347 RepID=A0AAN6NC22_9PEZI|nr:NADPH dehydrogenase [Diplogelasinospora grovesii]